MHISYAQIVSLDADNCGVIRGGNFNPKIAIDLGAQSVTARFSSP